MQWKYWKWFAEIIRWKFRNIAKWETGRGPVALTNAVLGPHLARVEEVDEICNKKWQ